MRRNRASGPNEPARGRKLAAVVLATMIVGGLFQAGSATAAGGESAVPQMLWAKQTVLENANFIGGAWANFDGLPGDEVLVGAPGSSDGRGVRVDRRDGTVLWRYPADPEQIVPYRMYAKVIGDVSGDGAPDIVAWGGYDLLMLSGRNGIVLSAMRSPVSSALLFVNAGQDLNSDGRPDLVLTDGYTVWAHSGPTLSPLWEFDVDPPTVISLIVGISMGDADGAGGADVAFFTGPRCGDWDSTPSVDTWRLNVLDGGTGVRRWSTVMPPESPPTGLAIADGMVVAKTALPRRGCSKKENPGYLLPDPHDLALTPQIGTQQAVSAHHGRTGAVAWQTVIPGPSRYGRDGLAIGDIGGDGTRAVVIASSPYPIQDVSTGADDVRRVGLESPVREDLIHGMKHNTDAIYAVELDSGFPMWAHKVDPRMTDTRLALIPRPGSGADVAYSTLHDVVMLSGNTGATLWTRHFPDQRPQVELQDLKGDGTGELAVQSEAGWRAGLSREDGSELWRISLDAPLTAAVRGPAGVGQPDLVVGDTAGIIRGLAADGSTRWLTQAGSAVKGLTADSERVLGVLEGLLPTTHTAVRGDVEIATNAVVAVDSRSGAILWRHAFDNGGLGLAHAFAEIDGDGASDVVVSAIGPDSHPVVQAVSGRTGLLLWEYVFPTSQAEPLASNSYADGMAVAGDALVLAMRSDAAMGLAQAETDALGLDLRTGRFRWAASVGRPASVSAMSDGTFVFTRVQRWTKDDPVPDLVEVTALSPSDGSEMWSRVFDGNFVQTATPEHVFLLRRDSTVTPGSLDLIVLDADGQVASAQDPTLPAPLAATVAVGGRLIYAGTLGVVELSIPDLLQGDVVPRRRFRLPERQHSTSSAEGPKAPVVVIDYPLVDNLLAFGPEEDQLLGYGLIATDGRPGAASWAADLRPTGQ